MEGYIFSDCWEMLRFIAHNRESVDNIAHDFENGLYGYFENLNVVETELEGEWDLCSYSSVGYYLRHFAETFNLCCSLYDFHKPDGSHVEYSIESDEFKIVFN
jgi:hypothetical protein